MVTVLAAKQQSAEARRTITNMSSAVQTRLHMSFAERLDELHEMLYRRGGIRPVNAAIEELAKLVLLQLKNADDPDWTPFGGPPISQLLDPSWISSGGDTAWVKRAFSEVIALPEFEASLPGGGSQPIWPLDEPFRLEQPDVLAAALELIDVELLRDLERREDYDLLGTAFDVLLRGRYDHAGGLATYLTPHSVASMLAEMCLSDLDVPTEWTVGRPCFGDPCCGTGRFLIAGLRRARGIAAEHCGDGPEVERFADAFGGSGLIGADQSSSAVAKARLNLLLYGVQRPAVFSVQDSVVDTHLDEARGLMRLILTNPPFGEGQYDIPEGVERTRRLLPTVGRRRAIDPALAFVARCLDLLGDGGRLGIILPDGLVDGAALRAALLGSELTRVRDVAIEASVSLPTATFALSGTVARTSAVVLKKGGAHRGFVFLAKAEHVGYLKQGGAAVPDPAGDDLPTIAQLGADVWSGRLGDLEIREGLLALHGTPNVTLVDREDLTTIDPSRVDPRARAARAEVLAEGGMHLEDLLTPRRSGPTPADGKRPYISVLHVGRLGEVAWHEALKYAPTTAGKIARAGELIVSLLNPSRLRATVIPDDTAEVICSSEFGIFVSSVDPYAVLVLLNDSRVGVQLSPLGRGTSSSRRRIDNTDLFSLVVPRVDTEVLERAAALRKAHGELRFAEIAAAKALRR